MIANPTRRQRRVFNAQIALTFPAAFVAGLILPSWWAVVIVPLAWIIPALYGATRDTMDERYRERSWSLMVHPSTWDKYLEIPSRPW